jgi:hypothetical protein
MSNDHDIGIPEDTVEFRDQLLFSRSIHCKLFPVWRSLICFQEPLVATCRPARSLSKEGRRTALM